MGRPDGSPKLTRKKRNHVKGRESKETNQRSTRWVTRGTRPRRGKETNKRPTKQGASIDNQVCERDGSRTSLNQRRAILVTEDRDSDNYPAKPKSDDWIREDL
ncbi:unnamed protein product [Camellia sinensis]